MLNVAIVGLGNIGNRHARVYQKRSDVKMVAVCDIIHERADKAAPTQGVNKFWGDMPTWDEYPEVSEIDVVVLNVNKEKQEISLGLKQTETNPWAIASQKYSCWGSPVRLSNGSTAMEGLSGNGNAIFSTEAGSIGGGRK